jgi:hypothetical protein
LYKKESTGSFFDRDLPKPGFSALKRDLAMQLESLPEETQYEVLTAVNQVLDEQGAEIAALFASRELHESLSDIAISALEREVAPASRTSTMAIPMLAISASGMLPALAMLAMMAAPAAATTAADFVIHADSPPGGSDLCSGVLFGCLQGYLTNGTQAWDSSMPQFSRVINQALAKASSSAYLQLRDCITLEKMGQIISKALTTTPPPTGPLQTAAATTGIWQGYQTSFQATSIPGSAASAVAAADMALGTSCQSILGATLKAGEIAGIAVGGCVGLVALCAVAYYCRAQISKCCDSRRSTERDETRAPATFSIV